MDRYTALQVFREVARRNGFAAAGRFLGLSPAAVSKNVAQLEAHLGTRLINRTTRRLSLTSEGLRYLEHVAPALDALEAADQALRPDQLEPSGLLKVSAPLTVTMTLLSRAIPSFLERHPRLRLELDLSDTRIDLVRDGFDLAIRGSTRLEDSSLVARKLGTLRYVVCGSPAYLARHGRPVTPADLHAHQCIRFSVTPQAGVWEFHQKDRTETVRIDARYAVSSSLAIIDALREGFGLSLVPACYVAADLACGRLVTVLDDWQTAELAIHAVYPSRRHLPTKVQAFIDFVAAAYADAAGGSKTAMAAEADAR